MSDDVKALIAEARLMAESSALGGWEKSLFGKLADALEASVQAPAVDREALQEEIARWLPMTAQDPDDWAKQRAALIVTQLFASGILQDAAEVEARGLEKAAESGEFNSTVCIALNKRAQQVREGNA